MRKNRRNDYVQGWTCPMCDFKAGYLEGDVNTGFKVRCDRCGYLTHERYWLKIGNILVKEKGAFSIQEIRRLEAKVEQWKAGHIRLTFREELELKDAGLIALGRQR